MPLPIAHGLIGASVIAATRNCTSLRLEGHALLLGATLGILPDVDVFFALVLGLGDRWHASFTHSILFALAVGWGAAHFMGRSNFREILLYAIVVFSHALLDILTRKTWSGAALLWPFSTHKFRLGLVDYFAFYPNLISDPLGEQLLRALRISWYELLIFTPVFLLALWIGQRINTEQCQETAGKI